MAKMLSRVFMSVSHTRMANNKQQESPGFSESSCRFILKAERTILCVLLNPNMHFNYGE
jgi:hypothetical protein